MPEARLRRTRASLPSGYQFGDGQCQHDYRAREWRVSELDVSFYIAICKNCGHDGGTVNLDDLQMVYGVGRWRSMHENAAEQIARNVGDDERRWQSDGVCHSREYRTDDQGIPRCVKCGAPRLTGRETRA